MNENAVGLLRMSSTPSGCGVSSEFYVVMFEGRVTPPRFRAYSEAFAYLEKLLQIEACRADVA